MIITYALSQETSLLLSIIGLITAIVIGLAAFATAVGVLWRTKPVVWVRSKLAEDRRNELRETIATETAAAFRLHAVEWQQTVSEIAHNEATTQMKAIRKQWQDVNSRLEAIESQLMTNGGTTLRDAVGRVEEGLFSIHREMAVLASRVDALEVTVTVKPSVEE